ncbi:MAG TPA: ABC transporter transmembrane domain-containing protein, partial [Chitinophagales bacterium]|nr:ABC transporter transmembrane domain-containing protein [Chitinophagales bacterium]
MNRRSEAIQRQMSVLTNIAQESFSGIRVIKAYNQEQPTNNEFANQSDQYKQRTLRLARVQAFFFPLMLFLIGFSSLLTIYIGGNMVIAGKITAGNVAEFVIYVNMLTWPITSVGWVASMVQQAAASQKRINEFLQTKPEITSPN